MEALSKYNKSSEESFALTNSQYLIWMGQKLNPDKPIYNMAWTFELKGPIDVLRFKQAFHALLHRSDNMRTVFGMEDQKPLQKVIADFTYELELIDWSAKPDSANLLEEWSEQRSQGIFDLGECLFDSALIKFSDEHYFWYLNQHHLIIDAWGNAIQYEALAAFYNDLEVDETLLLSPFQEYAVHENKQQGAPTRQPAINYWQEKSKALPNPPVFYGSQQSAVDTSSKRVSLDLGKDRSDALRQLAKQAAFRSWTEHLSLFNIFSTVLFAYLHRVSGQQKLAIGTPAHNRSTKAQKQTVGLFIEVFPLSVEIAPMATFASLLSEVRNEVNAYLKNAQSGSSSPELSRGYNVILNYINTTFPDFNGIPMRSNWIHPNHKDPAHHLRLQVHDFDQSGTIQLYFDLNTAVFDASLQKEAPQHFLRLLDSFIEDANQPIASPALVSGDLAIIGKQQTEETEATVLDLFEKQVQLNPMLPALRVDGRTLSYQELDQRSNQLAHFLLDHGLKQGDAVSLYLKRSPEFMIGVWAILKSGGTFVPIPTNYPSGRVLGIVADANARWVLTVSDLAASLPLPPEQMIKLDIEQAFINQQKNSKPDIQTNADDLAYLMYTSGSTGLPKGVMIAHRALAHYIRWAQTAYLSTEPAVMPLFTSVGFDLTITTLFLPLISGGSVVCYPEADDQPDLALLSVLADDLVNLIKLTPSHLALIKGRNCCESRIRTMIVGGEYFAAPLAQSVSEQFSPDLTIFNEYGPTEVTVGCVVHQYVEADQDHAAVPIGLPIADTTVYLLDEFLHAVPQGVIGELYIAGRGLAQGYWKQDELSKEKFIDNPFIANSQMYRTGDLVRLNQDGILEYLGRKDQQVKIGGRRIELEEISNALSKHPGINNSVVSLRKRGGSKSAKTADHNCVNCGLPSNYPKATFNEQGVCHLCLSFNSYQEKVQKYFRTIPDLKALFAQPTPYEKGEYDCIMLLSGGKDSSYALAQLVELGLKPLAFTLDNGYISEQAKDNVRRVCKELGVDQVFGETPAMNAIFVDSLQRHCNVCDGCFKTIYTLSIKLALEKNIPYIVTGLSRGQFFETRLTEELFTKEDFDADEIDEIILQARKAYHQVDDAVKELMDVSIFADDEVFERVKFVDFYRFTDVSLDEMLDYLDTKVPWIRPTDTGRSTNCLINQAGIFVHKKERGYSNYAFPYSWDVRIGHKTREASLDEINEYIDEQEVEIILDEIGYTQAQEEEAQSSQLVAYYTATQEVDEKELRNYLSSLLPDYMLPVQYIHLEALPLTVNGKIDHDALPEPDSIRPVLQVDYVAPRSDMEEMIAGLWSEILGIDKIGVFDNFIKIGGDSLSGIRLMAKLNETFELDLPINVIFEKTSVASMSTYVEEIITKLLAQMDQSE